MDSGIKIISNRYYDWGLNGSMNELSTSQLLIIVNLYAVLGLLVLGISTRQLFYRLRRGQRFNQQLRVIKFLIAIVPMLSCLALLAFGIFAMGMSHGSGPKDYQVILFILGCLSPIVLFILWIVGFYLVDLVWIVSMISLFFYFSFINPALYVRFWAEDNYQWAQLWLGEHYEEGSGGLDRVTSTARVWYKKAALNGSAQAQYKLAKTERNRKNAKKYYLMAAEQGHVDAIIQLIRLSGDEDKRQYWLDKAMANRHPEALFFAAEDAMQKDLPRARELMVQAAEKGSRSAIIFLVSEYQTGGFLFDQDTSLAGKWSSVLANTPPAETKSLHHTEIHINSQLENSHEKGSTAEDDVAEKLFRQANLFLRHPAKDDILHKRALAYLEKAADAEHGDAALQLAQIVIKDKEASEITTKALHWYKIAASKGNVRALKDLTLYFKKKQDVTIADLAQSEEYNLQLLKKFQADRKETDTFSQQNWMGELRNTKKVKAQLQRLGGSWQEANLQAESDPDKEYQLAKELLTSRQYKKGMVRMQSAAERGSMSARFELAVKIFTGPRSFSEEIEAITDLQDLDRQSYLPASFRLGFFYESNTGLVPKNLYLARELYRKVQGDTELKEKVAQRLENNFDLIEDLQIIQNCKELQQIEEWYSAAQVSKKDPTLLKQQYRALQNHFGGIGEMRSRAEKGEPDAQYNLAQMLQNHNLSEAMQWLKIAADNGNNNAQYELAVRMIKGKKNPPETIQAMKQAAFSAAENGHAGAMVFLATQFRNGYGGFEKNSVLARKYYHQVLTVTSGEIVFAGEVAGKPIIINRSSLERAVDSM